MCANRKEKKAYEVKNVKSNNFNFLIIPSKNEDLSVSLLIGKKKKNYPLVWSSDIASILSSMYSGFPCYVSILCPSLFYPCSPSRNLMPYVVTKLKCIIFLKFSYSCYCYW
uniref:Uncharacterized protein n=1 Tax=Nelumbo nucifera TaxID=4432 RepID=A0A822ZJ48_NELNU|nr:TPA_asm: hypothetical protein HUJ06_001705 [Nelumbo nucifera]